MKAMPRFLHYNTDMSNKKLQAISPWPEHTHTPLQILKTAQHPTTLLIDLIYTACTRLLPLAVLQRLRDSLGVTYRRRRGVAHACNINERSTRANLRRHLLILKALQPLICSHKSTRHVVSKLGDLPRHLIDRSIRGRHVLIE